MVAASERPGKAKATKIGEDKAENLLKIKRLNFSVPESEPKTNPAFSHEKGKLTHKNGKFCEVQR